MMLGRPTLILLFGATLVMALAPAAVAVDTGNYMPAKAAASVTPLAANPNVIRQGGDTITEAPVVLPARSPPQGELPLDAGGEALARESWPEIDQTGGSDVGLGVKPGAWRGAEGRARIERGGGGGVRSVTGGDTP